MGRKCYSPTVVIKYLTQIDNWTRLPCNKKWNFWSRRWSSDTSVINTINFFAINHGKNLINCVRCLVSFQVDIFVLLLRIMTFSYWWCNFTDANPFSVKNNVILWQFNYGKNRFIVLVPDDCPWCRPRQRPPTTTRPWRATCRTFLSADPSTRTWHTLKWTTQRGLERVQIRTRWPNPLGTLSGIIVLHLLELEGARRRTGLSEKTEPVPPSHPEAANI